MLDLTETPEGLACLGTRPAQNHLAPATERRIGNEARAKAGLSIAPYVWEPPKEERQSA